MFSSGRAAAFVRAAAAPFAMVLAGCGPSIFACTEDSGCRDGEIVGACEPDSLCSFPDPRCASGRRYGAHAGDRSNTCVDPMVASTGTSGGDSSSAATSTSTDHGSSTAAPTSTPGPTSDPTDATSTVGDTTSVPSDLPRDTEPLLWLDFADLDAPFANRGALGGSAICDPSTCPQPDASGTFAAFDGVDDCLGFAHDRALASADGLTAALWVRRDVDPADYTVTTALGKPLGPAISNSWAVYWVATPELGLRVFGAVNSRRGETSTAAAFGEVGAWVHLAITHDGATLVMYVDGELVDAQVGPGIGFDESPVYIGCDDDGAGLDYHVAGAIAEVRVYDRVLALEEIAALADASPAPL